MFSLKGQELPKGWDWHTDNSDVFTSVIRMTVTNTRLNNKGKIYNVVLISLTIGTICELHYE